MKGWVHFHVTWKIQNESDRSFLFLNLEWSQLGVIQFRTWPFGFDVFSNEIDGVPLLKVRSLEPFLVGILSHAFSQELEVRGEFLV